MDAATLPRMWRNSQPGGAKTPTTTSLLQLGRLARFLFWTAEASLRKLEKQHGALPETVESITPRGRHLFFKCENGAVRNSAGGPAPGLDIRGDGGYVVLPPSIHPSGRAYVWSVDSTDHFAEAPAWLSNLISGKANGICQRQSKSPEHWHRILRNTVRNGARNTTLTSICGKLLRTGVTELALLFDVMCCINIARCFCSRHGFPTTWPNSAPRMPPCRSASPGASRSPNLPA